MLAPSMPLPGRWRQLLLVGILTAPIVSATPLLDNLRGIEFNKLFARQCAVPCGWEGQLCCNSNQYCYTDSNNEAQCGNKASGGYWTTWTSTYVQTDLVTVTSVGSSFIGGSPVTATVTATATAACNYKLNESPCGPICCASYQYCVTSGQCAAAANPGSSGIWATTVTSAAFSPPLRPTDSTLVTVTITSGGSIMTMTTAMSTTATTSPTSVTTTESFLAPVATGYNVTMTKAHSSNNGLSGGAIAGIVIGVIFGVLLLLLICFYLCIKGILDGILALLGFGRRRRERETEVIEEYRGSRRDDRSYYSSGGRPARIERTTERRGSNLGREALGVAGGLAALWAFLGFRRSQDRKRRLREEEKSYYSGSAVTGVTSESSESSYVRPPPRARSRSRGGRQVRDVSVRRDISVRRDR